MNKQFTLQKKLSLSFAMLTLVTTAILAFCLYITFLSRYREINRKGMLTTVALIALQVDADKHNTLLTYEDEKSNTYLYLRKKLQRARDADHNIRYVYTMRMNKDSNIEFVIDAEEENPDEIAHLGDIYDDASELLKSKFSSIKLTNY